MCHEHRVFCLETVLTVEELAEKLIGYVWCLCAGFQLADSPDTLFLNDSFSPDGAQEYAVLRRLNGRWCQVDSITFGSVRSLDTGVPLHPGRSRRSSPTSTHGVGESPPRAFTSPTNGALSANRKETPMTLTTSEDEAILQTVERMRQVPCCENGRIRLPPQGRLLLLLRSMSMQLRRLSDRSGRGPGEPPCSEAWLRRHRRGDGGRRPPRRRRARGLDRPRQSLVSGDRSRMDSPACQRHGLCLVTSQAGAVVEGGAGFSPSLLSVRSSSPLVYPRAAGPQGASPSGRAPRGLDSPASSPRVVAARQEQPERRSIMTSQPTPTVATDRPRLTIERLHELVKAFLPDYLRLVDPDSVNYLDLQQLTVLDTEDPTFVAATVPAPQYEGARHGSRPPSGKLSPPQGDHPSDHRPPGEVGSWRHRSVSPERRLSRWGPARSQSRNGSALPPV